MPDKRYIAYYRTKSLGNGKYEHVAVLNTLGKEKYGTATYVDRIHIKGSKRIIKIPRKRQRV